MTEGETIYIVSSGSYSDYSVNAAFRHEADAQAYKERLGDDVETLTFYESLPEFTEILELRVDVMPEARLEDLRESTFSVVAGDPLEHIRGETFPWRTFSFVAADPQQPHLRLTESGSDHARVRKAFTERTAQAQEFMKDIPAGTDMRDYEAFSAWCEPWRTWRKTS